MIEKIKKWKENRDRELANHKNLFLQKCYHILKGTDESYLLENNGIHSIRLVQEAKNPQTLIIDLGKGKELRVTGEDSIVNKLEEIKNKDNGTN